MTVARDVMDAESFRAESDVSRETLERLIAYVALLKRWSARINLVSRSSLKDVWRRHVLDSAQLAWLLPEEPPGRPRIVVDLGSGAGFPGLVLSILGAGDVHLIEADIKKAAFLREAARVTAAPVTLHAARIEAVAPFSADVVTARALAPLPRLLAYAARFLRPVPEFPSSGPGESGAGRALEGTGLFLKGRSLEEELTDSTPLWTMDMDILPSRADPAGRILRLRRLQRRTTHV